MSQATVEQKPQEMPVPCLYNRDDAYLVQNPLQHHGTQLWEVLREKDTAQTYQEAGMRTWVILKSALLVLFFFITSLVALTLWLWGIGFRIGFHIRHWFEIEKPSVHKILSHILKVLVWPLKYAFHWADQFVRKYFGWELKIEPDISETPETSNSSS